METCIISQHNTIISNNNRTSDHLTIVSDELSNKTTLRRSATSLSDLIPKAAAALKTKQRLKQQEEEEKKKKEDILPTPTTTFGRALTKVKLQIQTKRLKERYLGHEWIRLALSLPVDVSHINFYVYYLNEEKKTEEKKKNETNLSIIDMPISPPPTTTTSTSSNLLSLSSSSSSSSNCQHINDHISPIMDSVVSPPSSPKPTLINNNDSSIEININNDSSKTTEKKNDHDHGNMKKKNHNNNNNHGYYCNFVSRKVPTSRTSEIVAWYEWKLKKVNLSMEEIESRVDNLRKLKLQDKFSASTPNSLVIETRI